MYWIKQVLSIILIEILVVLGIFTFTFTARIGLDMVAEGPWYQTITLILVTVAIVGIAFLGVGLLATQVAERQRGWW